MSIPPDVKNLLLARLPPAEYRRVLEKMRPVTLEFKQVLYKYLEPIDFV